MIKADYIIGIAMLLMLATHASTHFIAVKYSTYQKEQKQAESIMQFVEQNPVGSKILNLDKFKYFYSFFFAPSVLLAFYYYLRTTWKDKNENFLTAMSVFFLAFTFQNFLNDFSYLLGLMAR